MTGETRHSVDDYTVNLLKSEVMLSVTKFRTLERLIDIRFYRIYFYSLNNGSIKRRKPD